MKNVIMTSTLLVASLTFTQASVSTEFKFGDIFKELKVAQDSTITNFKFGDIFKDLKTNQTKVSHVDFKFGDIFKDLKKTAN